MTTVKVRRSVNYTVTDDEGREFEIEFEPSDYHETIIRELADGGWVVGYLCQDNNASNPLEDCDACGHIYDGRRDVIHEIRDKYREAVGIDHYGDLIEDFKPDPLIVLLDVYSHGMDAWRVHGGGRYFPDEQWDVSNCAGVWVPDKYCVEHIELTAAEKAYGVKLGCSHHKKIVYGKGKSYTLYHYTHDGKRHGRFQSVKKAVQSYCTATGVAWDPDKFLNACREEAVVCAGQAVETYNSWLSGDVWGVCFDTYDAEFNHLDNDSCWGYVGGDYAEEELKMRVEAEVRHAKEARKVKRSTK